MRIILKKKIKTTLILVLTLALCLSGCSNLRPIHPKAKSTPTSYISKKLLDNLSKSILTNKVKEQLKDMVSDKKLSNKELKAYISDKTVAKYKKQMDEYGGYVLRVDADNDGIKDLFFLIEDGGTMGNNSRILLKGKKNGTYKMTSAKVNVTQELAFIKYMNKNYLVETSFSYDYKYYDGLIVLYFKDGKIYEKATLTMKAGGYDVSTQTSNDKYKDLADEASKITRKHYDVGNMDGKILKGDAETAVSEENYQSYEQDLHFQEYHWFRSDIDNDGVNEVYTKGIFYTSTISSLTHLQDALITNNRPEGDQYPSILSYYSIKVEGTPEMFWISTVDKENILNVITYQDLTNYSVSGYLINSKSVSRVYEVKFKGKPKVVKEVYTRGRNYKEDKNGWE